MNETKKVIVVFSVVVAIISIIIGLSVCEDLKYKKEYKKFQEALNSNENTLVYIGIPICDYCLLLNLDLEDMISRYNFNYTYINADELNDKYLTKLFEDLQVTELTAPSLVIVSNGKVIDLVEGYRDYPILFDFLQYYGIIDKESELLLNYIDIEKYNEIIKEKDQNIIVIGKTIDNNSVNARIILNEIASSNDIEINYLSVSKQSELTTVTSSFKELENDFESPTILIVKKGKIVDMLDKAVTKEEYIEFFEKNGEL